MKSGTEGIDIPSDLNVPTCGIEDVDRAMFKLFNEDIPLYWTKDDELKKIPIIFGAGERAFLLRRKEPIRDSQGALILPLVSILRTTISHETQQGIGPGDGELTIKRRLAPEDQNWKKLTNPGNLQNSQDTFGSSGAGNSGLTDTSLLLDPSRSIFEVVTIPVPRFYKATYEVTFWAQYQSQMNHMIEAFLSSYNIRSAQSFRIESPKGWWFVATAEDELRLENNIDDYTNEERRLQCVITLNVNGYIVGPSFPGAPNDIRRYTSAPFVSFDVSDSEEQNFTASKHASNNPDNYTFEDFASENAPLPGQGVHGATLNNENQRVSIGNMVKDSSQRSEIMKNPFTDGSVKTTVKAKNLSKGERVYAIIENLDK
jgi:hypothetical protein